jgi:hypothetical protein
LREKDDQGNLLDLDGFELVRRALAEIKAEYVSETGVPTEKLLEDINSLLIRRVEDACGVRFDTGEIFVGGLNSGSMALLMPNGRLQNRCIPKQIINHYKNLIVSKKLNYNSAEKQQEINEAR